MSSTHLIVDWPDSCGIDLGVINENSLSVHLSLPFIRFSSDLYLHLTAIGGEHIEKLILILLYEWLIFSFNPTDTA